ncbi:MULTISPECIES: MauE/DoxX family redox-associated membrane protein [Kitasatospora]|uniref:Methylamine utilisation protein MauE domain-containing protein n=1 Tax=Kitasatospora cystarginea TaxID=58350 RepID=A0ABN3EYR5_9ACTN
MEVLELSARITLIVVFGAAVFGKCRSRRALRQFAAGLADFGWIPARLRLTVALAVLAAEVGAVPLLLGDRQVGAVLAFGLLAVFTVATVQAGRAAACQCFGTADTPAAGGTAAFVTRNSLLMGLALVAGLVPGGAPALPVWVAAVGVGAALGAVVIGWDEVAYLRS